MVKMTSSQLTIVLLTYNRANFLKRAIDGILSQTFHDYELIILDNASADETQKIVEGYSDHRIKYIRHAKNIGRENGNYALRMNNSQYFMITHDDDIMKPSLLEKEVEVLRKNEQVLMVSANVDAIDEQNNIICKKMLPIDRDVIYNKYGFIMDYCVKNKNHIVCPTVMLRGYLLREKRLFFDNSIGQASDTYLWFEINTFDGQIYILKDSLYYYRLHNTQDSAKLDIKMRIYFYGASSRLIKSNRLDFLVPSLRKVLLNDILRCLLSDYLSGRTEREQVAATLDEVKKNDLWDKKIPFSLKIKLLLIENKMRLVLKALFRLESLPQTIKNKIKNKILKRDTV